MSDTAPPVGVVPKGSAAFHGSHGLPVPLTDIKLMGDDDNEVARGERNELCAFRPQCMSGYWVKPEAQKEALAKDGHFRTDDNGAVDLNGFLRIVGRKKGYDNRARFQRISE